MSDLLTEAKDLVQNREPREATARSTTERKQIWMNPSFVDTPEPPPGFAYYWVRDQIHGENDDKNVINRQRQGYEAVTADELPEGYHFTTNEHRLVEGGVVRSGDCILMKVSLDIKQQREAYFDNKAKTLQASVDGELNRNHIPDMPIHNDSSSSVSRGSPDFQND